MSIDHEVIIIGGGFAGAFAAHLCAQGGLKTTLLNQAPPRSQFFSGAFDFYDDPRASSQNSLFGNFSLQKTLDEIATREINHVYSHLFHCARELHRQSPLVDGELTLSSLLRESSRVFFESFEIQTMGDGRNYLKILTPSGILKPSAYALEGFLDMSSKPQPLLLIEIKGLKDYSPRFIKHELQKSGWNDIEILSLDFDLKQKEHLSTVDVAQYLDSEKGLTELLAQLPQAPGRAFIFPPVLGVIQSGRIREGIQKKIKSNCYEILSMPPSVMGLRVFDQINKSIKIKNLLQTLQVTQVRETINDVEVETLNQQGQSRVLKSNYLVVATGKKNLTRESHQWRHVLLGITLSDGVNFLSSQSPHQLLNDREDQSQALFGVGLQTDLSLRPRDLNQNFKRVFACGHSLAGFDFATQRCGFGVSVLSAYLAAKKILQSKSGPIT